MIKFPQGNENAPAACSGISVRPRAPAGFFARWCTLDIQTQTETHTLVYYINIPDLNFSKYTTALTELVNYFSSSAVGIPNYKFSAWNLKLTWHKSALDICSVCVVVSESRECVDSRLVARGDGLGGRELLDAVGTLLKGCEKFLEI